MKQSYTFRECCSQTVLKSLTGNFNNFNGSGDRFKKFFFNIGPIYMELKMHKLCKKEF